MASKTATAPAGEPAAASKPKLVRPDQAKMEADVAALEAEAKRLDAQVTAVEADISARQAASSSNRAIASEARALFNELRAQQDRIKKEKEAIQAQIEANKTAVKPTRASAAAAADRPRYKNEEEVNEAIERLEYRQSSESLSVPEERAILKQITDLRAIKNGFRAAVAAEEKFKRDRESFELSRKELYARLSEKIEEQKAISARVTAQKEIMTTIAPKDDSIKELMDKKYALKKEAHIKRVAAKQVKDDFFKARRAFNEAQKEENARRDAERLQRQLAYQKEAEQNAAAEVAAEVEEEDNAHPWADELEECDRLIAYLNKLSVSNTVAAAASPVPTDAAAGGKAFKKKGLRDDDSMDFLSGNLDSRAAKAKKAPTKPKALTHTFESLNLFAKFGVAPPTAPDQFPAAITAVEEKKQYYTTAPAPEKPAKTAASASAPSASGVRATVVLTPYGPASVSSVRDDNVLVVKFSKFEAVGYLQQNQVKLMPRPRNPNFKKDGPAPARK